MSTIAKKIGSCKILLVCLNKIILLEGVLVTNIFRRQHIYTLTFYIVTI